MQGESQEAFIRVCTHRYLLILSIGLENCYRCTCWYFDGNVGGGPHLLRSRIPHLNAVD